MQFAKTEVKSYVKKDGTRVGSFWRKHKGKLIAGAGVLGGGLLLKQHGQIRQLKNTVGNLTTSTQKLSSELGNARQNLVVTDSLLASTKRQAKQAQEAVGRYSGQLQEAQSILEATKSQLAKVTRQKSSREKAFVKAKEFGKSKKKEVISLTKNLGKEISSLTDTLRSEKEISQKYATLLKRQNSNLRTLKKQTMDYEDEMEVLQKKLARGEAPFTEEIQSLKKVKQANLAEIDNLNTTLDRYVRELALHRQANPNSAKIVKQIKDLETEVLTQRKAVNAERTTRRIKRLGVTSVMRTTDYRKALADVNRELSALKSRRDPTSQARYIELKSKKDEIASQIRGRVSKLGGGNWMRATKSDKARRIRVGQVIVDPTKKRRDYDFQRAFEQSYLFFSRKGWYY